MNSEVMIERLGRASRVSGVLIAIGTLVVTIALWLSYSQIRILRVEKTHLEQEKHRLEQEKGRLEQELAEKREAVGVANQRLAYVEKRMTELQSLPSEFPDVRFDATATPENRTGGPGGTLPLFTFRIRVKGPPEQLDLIASVAYRFPAGFRQETRRGARADSFAVQYSGWDCTRTGDGVSLPLIVTITPTKGPETTTLFDLCKSVDDKGQGAVSLRRPK